MAFPIRFSTMRQTMEPMRNCGSLIEPLIGRSMSITPLLSASSETASRIGRFGAWLPSTRSPNCSCPRHDLVARLQLTVGRDLVAHRHGQLALLDAVSRVLDAVGRQRWQLGSSTLPRMSSASGCASG